MSMRFELNYLDSYDEKSLIAEIQRVADLVKSPKLTQTQFEEHAKVARTTLARRFGSWSRALEAAGLSHRLDDANVSFTRDAVLEAIKIVAANLNKDVLTLNEFVSHSGIDDGPVRRLFGSWKEALIAAELRQSSLGKRYTDEACFENMLSMWTQFGRAPQHREMNVQPSQVGSKAYVRRWGTWRKALAAFVQRMHEGAPVPVPVADTASSKPLLSTVEQGPRDIPLALRYYVLRRDSFRCVACGASPAITAGVILHIDHIHPWALGGATVADNLRVLCLSCNLGKGVTPA